VLTTNLRIEVNQSTAGEVGAVNKRVSNRVEGHVLFESGRRNRRERAPEGTRMRGGSSDRPSTAGEAGTVSKRRQESLEKHAGGTKLGARQMRIRKVKRGGD
jgi:hypothetical protein